MTPTQIAWIKLISLAVGTGCAAGVTAYSTGSKLWAAIAIGVGTAGMNIYHAVSQSPKDAEPPK